MRKSRTKSLQQLIETTIKREARFVAFHKPAVVTILAATLAGAQSPPIADYIMQAWTH